MNRDKSSELVDYLEAHKDDAQEWEAEPANVRVAKEPSVVFSLRLKPKELASLQAAAEQQQTTVSAVIRRALRRYLESPEKASVTLRAVYGLAGTLVAENLESHTTARISRRNLPEEDAVTA